MPWKLKSSKRKASRNRKLFAVGILTVTLIAIGMYYVFTSLASAPATETPIVQGRVLLQTSMGDIVIELRDDKPITSGNFKNLVEQGKYDGTIFHRVIEGFMIQGGQIADSVSPINDEIGTDNRNIRGTIAMANTGAPNSASSQFFINLVDNGAANTGFDSAYTVFGNVIDGMDVVDAISQVPTVANPAMNNEVSAPVNDVTLISATILP